MKLNMQWGVELNKRCDFYVFFVEIYFFEEEKAYKCNLM